MSIDWIVKIIQQNWQMFLTGAWITLYISIIGTIIGTLLKQFHYQKRDLNVSF